MRFIADLHIHSKYSRATSKDMCLEELDRWADDKGIFLMATGDFTHPAWFAEIKKKLEPAFAKGSGVAMPGFYQLKKEFKKPTLKGTFAETRFILSTEISSIYSRDGRVYRVHNLVFSPSIEVAEEINKRLGAIGNIKSDGRPILGLDCRELARIIFEVSEESVIIPAHAWTPWFSVFGTMSGFDSIEDCYGEYAGKIFAIETGLSSDPAMNWRLSMLDKIAFVSNSDSHSLQKIGREANVFEGNLEDFNYFTMMNAIANSASNSETRGIIFSDPRPMLSAESRPFSRRRAPKGSLKTIPLVSFSATLEFFPEEGKYHYDGHRDCGVCFSPEETKKHKEICPKCGKKLTVGVMNRVAELADKEIMEHGTENMEQNIKQEVGKQVRLTGIAGRVPFVNLISLDEIIAEAFDCGPKTKKVKSEYESLIKKFGSELKILLDVSEKELATVTAPVIVESVKRVRKGEVIIRPGYDGEYGEIKIL